MKTKILIITAAFCYLTGHTANAQLNFGGSLGYDKYLGGSDLSFINISVNGEYAIQDEMGIRLSFVYCLPKKYDTEYSGYALSSATSPSYITVGGDYSVSVMRFLLDYKKYWFDGDYDDGGLYGAVGIGLSLASTKDNIDSYDATSYDINAGEPDASYSQFYIRLHLGYDIKLDAISIFIEPGLDLAANKVNDATVDLEIPSLYGINAGIRFSLD